MPRPPRTVTTLARVGGTARHAVSSTRGRNGRYTIACTCGWWTDDIALPDTADRQAREHLQARNR